VTFAKSYEELDARGKRLFKAYSISVGPILTTQAAALYGRIFQEGNVVVEFEKNLSILDHTVDWLMIGSDAYGMSLYKLKQIFTETGENTLGMNIVNKMNEYMTDSYEGDLTTEILESVVIDFADLSIGLIDCSLSQSNCVDALFSQIKKLSFRLARLYHRVTFFLSANSLWKEANALMVTQKYIQKYVENHTAYSAYPSMDDIQKTAAELGFKNNFWHWPINEQYDENLALKLSRKFIAAIRDIANSNIIDSLNSGGTNHRPNRPSITLRNGTTNTTLQPYLQAGSFSDPDGDNHWKTWWGIKSGKTNTWVWESGWKTDNLYEIHTPSNILQAGQKYKETSAKIKS